MTTRRQTARWVRVIAIVFAVASMGSLVACTAAASPGSPLDLAAGYRGPASDVDQYSLGNAAGWELLIQVVVGTVLLVLGLYLYDKYLNVD
jgi:hypothetical protein